MSQPLRPLFRPSQLEALKYRSGTMAISAVPGSGKTFTLTHIAANLIDQLSKRDIASGREVLIVTFTNSAVNTIRQRIAHILQRDRGLLPYSGYRVRTLHGLAHDIIRERPALAGLPEDFSIIDERTSLEIIRGMVHTHLEPFEDQLAGLIDPLLLEDPQQRNRIKSRELPGLMLDICLKFIRHAKDNRLGPGDLYAYQSAEDLSLLMLCSRVYDDYQRSLRFQSALDFDDLGRLALDMIESDPGFLSRLQKQWTHILEDEAQDSSAVQQSLLMRLTDSSGNWVRAGDPNQAINTTFTTADYHHFVAFSLKADHHIRLSHSGRSGFPIADLANKLITWTIQEHPTTALRQSFASQYIETTLPGDPQPAPLAQDTRIHIHYQPGKSITPQQEIDLLLENLAQWLPENTHKTVAVLTPENSRGFKVIEQLNSRNIAAEELLRTTSDTRLVTNALFQVLSYLASPLDSKLLSRVYQDVWHQWLSSLDADTLDSDGISRQGASILARCRNIEDYLWPVEQTDEWLFKLNLDFELLRDLQQFRDVVQRWLQALILPVDQLILTISQEVFKKPSELALSYKIAGIMKSLMSVNPTWQLADLADELQLISQNQRRFLGMEDLIAGYEPQPGVVTVSTMHSAKGLEWDRVYLLGLNDYSFPSGDDNSQYLGEKWFVRDQLNLEAEALAQITAIGSGKTYTEGVATRQARLDYSEERLRLFYVGITRAKEELIMLWNSGRFWYRGNDAQPALPLKALQEYVSGTRIIQQEGKS